jgi:hypothetical protein
MPEPCRNARGWAEQVHALPARQTQRSQQREPQAGPGHATWRQGRNRPLDMAKESAFLDPEMTTSILTRYLGTVPVLEPIFTYIKFYRSLKDEKKRILKKS